MTIPGQTCAVRLCWGSGSGVGCRQVQALSSPHACLELLGFTALRGAGSGWGRVLPGLAILLSGEPALLPPCPVLHAALVLCPAAQPGACSWQSTWGPEHPGYPLPGYHCLLRRPLSCKVLQPSPSLLTALMAHFPLSLPPGCPKGSQRDVPTLPGVAFLVPHSYWGVKLGLQL